MPCDDLTAFIDGELEPEPAAKFREHLAICATCRREVLAHVQLSAQLSTLEVS